MQAGQRPGYTGRVKLALNRQSSRMTVWKSILSCGLEEDIHVIVNSLSGTNGSKSPFYRVSGSAFPVCVPGSHFVSF